MFTDPDGLETGSLPLPEVPKPVVFLLEVFEGSDEKLGLEGSSSLMLPEGTERVKLPEDPVVLPVIFLVIESEGSSRLSLGLSSVGVFDTSPVGDDLTELPEPLSPLPFFLIIAESSSSLGVMVSIDGSWFTSP